MKSLLLMKQEAAAEPPEAPTKKPPEASADASGGDAAPAAEAAAEKERAEEPEEFSALELRDRVVVMLLFNQVAQIDHVEAAWKTWRQLRQKGEAPALWRVLAAHPDVDREAVFEEAARVYAFEEMETGRYSALAFVRAHRDAFSGAQWQRLVEASLVPVKRTRGERTSWFFATHDPAHADIGALLEALGVEQYTLRYAPEALVRELLHEVLPETDRPQPAASPYADVLGRVLQREEDSAPPAEASSADVSTDVSASEPQDETTPDEASPAPEVSRSSLSTFFEDLLVAATQAKATRAYVFPNAEEHIEIRFDTNEGGAPWRVERSLPAASVMTFLKRDVMQGRRSVRAASQQEPRRRWIDGKLVGFHLSIVPLDVQDWAEPVEMFVIDLLPASEVYP